MWDIIFHKWLGRPHRLHVSILKKPKKPRASLLFIHGIGASSNVWSKVINDAPRNLSIATVDLLGFGNSPKPTWAEYDAQRQARSVIYTCKKLRLKGPLIIIGHSLGALVAVEIAKLQSDFADRLILCSPPFYRLDSTTRKLLPSSDKILKDLYRAIQNNPEQFIKISALAARYGIIDRAFTLNDSNIHSYMSALETSIVNQTAFDDIQSLDLPIEILYGTLDPVLITKHIKTLQKRKENITVNSVVAGHNVRGPYVTAVKRAIRRNIDELTQAKSQANL